MFAKTDCYCRFNDSLLGITAILVSIIVTNIGWFSFGAVLQHHNFRVIPARLWSFCKLIKNAYFVLANVYCFWEREGY